MKRYLIVNKEFKIVQKKEIQTPNNKKLIKRSIPLVNYLNIGYYLITPLLVGVFLGLTIDRRFRLNGKVTLIFIGIGTVTAFYNLYKIYKNG